jgi:hypothetical protein
MDVVKPGLNIRIVIEVDPMMEKISVKPSTIYEVADNLLIIAQTEPAITKLRQQITITYLVRENGRLRRRGFPAQVADLIDYSLQAGCKVKAIVAEKNGEPQPFSVRMHYRAEPTVQSRLAMYILGRKVDILDISLRGARFSHPRTLGVQPGAFVGVCLDIAGRSYDLEGRIVRIWESTSDRVRRETAFASVEFLTLGATAERALLRRIHQIERDSRPNKFSP